MSQHDTDIDAVRAMEREELEAKLVALWGDIRNRMYASDLRRHLPESPATPPPPWPEIAEFDGYEDDSQ